MTKVTKESVQELEVYAEYEFEEGVQTEEYCGQVIEMPYCEGGATKIEIYGFELKISKDDAENTKTLKALFDHLENELREGAE